MSAPSTERLLWVPLESTPEIFNSYAKKLGVLTSRNQFVDLYGFDSEAVEAIPKPAKAVILVFPGDKETDERERQEDARIAKDGQPHLDPTIFWVKQTIGNACGTMALIHALANSDVDFSPTSIIQKFIINARDKSPEERVKLLEQNEHIARIHGEEASSGTSAPRMATELHYVCFVAAPDADVRRVADGDQSVNPAPQHHEDSAMRLIELDGGRIGPVDRGPCHNLLEDTVDFVKRYYLPVAKSDEFNIQVLVPT